MATMKKAMDFILAELMVLPALMVFNENEKLWVNAIGFAYIILMALLSRRGKCKVFVNRLMTYL